MIIQPDIISDGKRYVKLLNREYKNLKPIVEAREQLHRDGAAALLKPRRCSEKRSDPDFKEMAKMELEELEPAFAERCWRISKYYLFLRILRTIRTL